ncbi:response regulator [Sorangium sp. So ce362]|uniref:hybrid sensor histidine kinase/response regulator n=1 Tax=Sorangium sp. So ce362 TaxID=3133303 RepID=UPI003F5FD05C
MNDSEIKVLLVDDDEVDHLVTRRLLREVSRTRYDVTWVSTSDEALEALLAGGYDVCLLDFRLDARTGLEVVHEANRLGCAIPIIMLTGVGDEEIDMAAMSAGAADYLVKGRFDAQILERTIRYAIEHKRSQLKLKQYADTLEESNRQLLQMHEELAAKNAELVRLNEEKNRFVGMAAHDLRNPLGVILGYSDFMLMTHRRGEPSSLLQDGGVEIIEMIRSSSKFMLSLINDLLDVSMIELGLKQALGDPRNGPNRRLESPSGSVLPESRDSVIVAAAGQGSLVSWFEVVGSRSGCPCLSASGSPGRQSASRKRKKMGSSGRQARSR